MLPRCFCVVVLGLAWPVIALAQEKQEKPILVLDAGGHTARVGKVIFTPDGRELITVSNDKTIRFWDVSTGEALRVLRPPIGKGPEGKLYAAALSPDGKILAVGGYGLPDDKYGTIYLISLPAGRIERLLKGHPNVIQCLAFSRDGRHLASGSNDNTARIWDVATGTCEQTLEGHTLHINGVTFSPDGRRLATASYDKTGRIWSLASGQVESILRGHDQGVHCVAWSLDGTTVATGSYDQSIRLWKTDGTFRRKFEKLGGGIMSVAFTADSRELLFTTWPPEIMGAFLLDLATGKERIRFPHDETVFDGALSQDGSLAASTGGNNFETFIWKTADGMLVARLAGKGKSVWAAAWSPDGKALAWGNKNEGGAGVESTPPLEHSFRLADLEFGDVPDAAFRRAQWQRGSLSLSATGRTTVNVKRGTDILATLKLKQEYDEVRCFTLLPGDRAAVGASWGLYLFDTRNGQRLRTFQGHTGEVWAVASSPDGRYLLSASGDQTLRVWDPEHDEPLVSLFFAGDEWIAWTPEGYYATSPGGERLMGWHVNNGKEQMASFYPAAQFRKSLYRPDVIKLLLRTGSVEKALELADQARSKDSERTEVSKILPPRVTITAPASSGLRTAETQVTVRAVAASVGGHPVTALRLLLDGRPYQGQAGVQKVADPRPGEVHGSWTVQVKSGKHRLQVQADSAVSQGLSEEVEVTCVETAPAVELPGLYVLAVGVSDYRGDLKLHYAAKDAQAVAAVLQQHSKSLFRRVEVKTLTDNQATKIEILKGLTWLRKQMTQSDVGVLFFAGHGQRDQDGHLYLLPVDVDTDNLLATGVADDDLKRALQGMPGRVLTLLDACHAGAIGGDKRRNAEPLTDDLVRDLVTNDYGVIVMCSSMARELSLESNEHRHGYFTLALTEGLIGKAKTSADGAVYLHALNAYVTERVKELSQGRQHPVTAQPTTIRSFPLSRPRLESPSSRAPQGQKPTLTASTLPRAA